MRRQSASHFANPLLISLLCLITSATGFAEKGKRIDRQTLVTRHNPVISKIDPEAPLTLGNGQFAFTADVTGLQSMGALYFSEGVPLETKAKWAWHSRANTKNFVLDDANEEFSAYGRKVNFPTNVRGDSGQWLRQNPHDLPLARVSLRLDNKNIGTQNLGNVRQVLDLWRGVLDSQYSLAGVPVSVTTVAHDKKDLIAAHIESSLLDAERLSIGLQFPRGYDLALKNGPDINWGDDSEHHTTLIRQEKNSALFRRQIDDQKHWVNLRWEGSAALVKTGKHQFQLRIQKGTKKQEGFAFSIEFLASEDVPPSNKNLRQVKADSESAWAAYWRSGAAIDFSGSTDPRAKELERRIVLSQYLMAVQSRASVPTQETGLTASSWYGKHHTEMTLWHSAHWIKWGRLENAERVLKWYQGRLGTAQKLAAFRGLRGARWAKMVGPDGRESPGGNPLIIWNQPQPIHLAEMLYQHGMETKILKEYAELVAETAAGLSSMLLWSEAEKRYSLEPPIWIAQEIYEPELTRNPGFELSYWRYGLQTAQAWRKRLGQEENTLWKAQLDKLAALPHKAGKYVAIESLPDTFDNIASRQDHPTMLAPWGLLDDETVDVKRMRNTLMAVLETWDWEEKIWGWDYPMIAMTAAKLGEAELAVDILLKNAPHNRYLPNGHCPQEGAALPVYLPANGALLLAIAKLAKTNRFPVNGKWRVRSEGF